MTAQALSAIAALTFHADRRAAEQLQALARGRRARAETTRSLSKDITNGVVEDQLGPRPGRHRKEARS